MSTIRLRLYDSCLMLDYVHVINILLLLIVIINYSLRTRLFAQSSTKKDKRTAQKQQYTA